MITDKSGRSGTGPYDLTGKVAIVTGAVRRLGCVIARGFASAGPKGLKMVLGSRQIAHLSDTVATIKAGGGEAQTHAVDIMSPQQCELLKACEVSRCAP